MADLIQRTLQIDIKGLTDKYDLEEFKTYESLGGDIAEGELTYKGGGNKELKCDYEVLDISISDTEGKIKSYKAYVYDLNRFVNSNVLKFICAPKDFITKVVTKSYKSVLQAIKANWNGELDTIPKSMPDITCDIHQRNETGYKLVQKLIKGLRYNSVYGFRCDSIVIRELKFVENYDYYQDVKPKKFPIHTDNIDLNKSKFSEIEPKNEDIGVATSIVYSQQFYQIRSNYKNFYLNMIHNVKVIDLNANLDYFKFTVTISRFDPKYRLGRIIQGTFRDINGTQFLISRVNFSWNRAHGPVTELELMKLK
jgi:hypothetical protein